MHGGSIHDCDYVFSIFHSMKYKLILFPIQMQMYHIDLWIKRIYHFKSLYLCTDSVSIFFASIKASIKGKLINAISTRNQAGIYNHTISAVGIKCKIQIIFGYGIIHLHIKEITFSGSASYMINLSLLIFSNRNAAFFIFQDRNFEKLIQHFNRICLLFLYNSLFIDTFPLHNFRSGNI